MEAKLATLGRSLLVPSVQELAKEQLSSIPPRYIRSDVESAFESDTAEQLPVISLQSLLYGDTSELQKLHFACQQWGFFQLVSHGVSSSLIEKFKSETLSFFDLPMEEKKAYWQTAEDVEGFGQLFVMSEEQKLDWADIFFLSTLPKDIRKPHLLPMLPLPLRADALCRDTLDTYSSEMKNLSMKILDCMGKALKIDGEYMRGLFEDGKQSIRINYYPPCPHSDKVVGFSPHSDASGLTVVLQLNEVLGHQIKKDGKWIPIKPLLHAFVVNVGDTMEIISNGIYRSIEHRAVVNQTKERLSAATFYSPSIHCEIGPHPSLITPETPAKFRGGIKMPDFIKGFFEQKLTGKTYLDSVRIG
ncbi:hypothetical protein V2J09_016604 [Rumex salicifolius]